MPFELKGIVIPCSFFAFSYLKSSLCNPRCFKASIWASSIRRSLLLAFSITLSAYFLFISWAWDNVNPAGLVNTSRLSSLSSFLDISNMESTFCSIALFIIAIAWFNLLLWYRWTNWAKSTQLLLLILSSNITNMLSITSHSLLSSSSWNILSKSFKILHFFRSPIGGTIPYDLS